MANAKIRKSVATLNCFARTVKNTQQKTNNTINMNSNINNTEKLLIHYLPVSCGDAIHIQFVGEDDQVHHILIDGGYKTTYDKHLKPILQKIAADQQYIDIWIVTHYDCDHINGVLAFAEDQRFDRPNQIPKNKLVKEFWYNRPIVETLRAKDTTESDLIGIRQGISLSEFLTEHNFPKKDISIETPIYEIFGAKIMVLSPTIEQIGEYRAEANKQAIDDGLIGVQGDDYNTPLKDFDIDVFSKQSDPINDSSIALYFKFDGFSAIFLADSNPETILENLEKCPDIERDKKGKILLTHVKLAHHGSKKNTHLPLIQKIEAKEYIVLANGKNTHKLPNKETFARIVRNPQRLVNDTPICFFFNFDNSKLKSIFTPSEIEEFKIQPQFYDGGYTYKHP